MCILPALAEAGTWLCGSLGSSFPLAVADSFAGSVAGSLGAGRGSRESPSAMAGPAADRYSQKVLRKGEVLPLRELTAIDALTLSKKPLKPKARWPVSLRSQCLTVRHLRPHGAGKDWQHESWHRASSSTRFSSSSWTLGLGPQRGARPWIHSDPVWLGVEA